VRSRILPNRNDPGGCTLRLTHAERTLLASLPKEIDDALEALAAAGGTAGATGETAAAGAGGAVGATPEDAGSPAMGPAAAGEASSIPPAMRRLFPPAYTRDDEAERNYVEIARPGLLEHHRRALRTLVRTAKAKTLDAEELDEWMTALNDVRLVLGTVLDVREDAEPPAGRLSQQLLYYYYLSGLQTELVDYLARDLPPPVPGADDEIPDDPWGEPLGGLRWDGTPRPTDGP